MIAAVLKLPYLLQFVTVFGEELCELLIGQRILMLRTSFESIKLRNYSNIPRSFCLPERDSHGFYNGVP